MKHKQKAKEPKQGRPAARRAKGTGTVQKHGRTYRAVWIVDGKTFTRSTGTADKREAEKRLAEFVAPYRLKQQAGKDAAAAKTAAAAGLDAVTASALSAAASVKRAAAGRLLIPLSKAWDAFNTSLSRKTVSAEVNRIYKSRWGVFRAWMEANRPGIVGLADVDKETAEEFLRGIKARYSPKTFNDYRVLLAQVWKILDEAAGLEGFNPWRNIQAMDKDPHSRRELTAEELGRVVAPLEGEMRVLFAIGIYTGLRLGDAVNLSWGKVDLVRGFIQCKPHKTLKKKGTVVRIPLFPALASILAETPAKERRGLVLPGLAAEYSGTVETDADGNKIRKPGHPQYTAERVRKVFEAAGIETQGRTGRINPKTQTERKAVEVGFHSLRHTFVSLCANAGVPLPIVQAIVGHSNVAMTEHYFHVSDDALRGAVAVLPNVFGGERAALPAHTGAETVEDAAPADAEAVEAFETVPASVAKVARMLVGCTPEQLEKVEKFVAGMLAERSAK